MSDAVCFDNVNLDGDQTQGSWDPPVTSLPSVSSLLPQSGQEYQAHWGLAKQREGTWQRSLEATLPRTEMMMTGPPENLCRAMTWVRGEPGLPPSWATREDTGKLASLRLDLADPWSL